MGMETVQRGLVRAISLLDGIISAVCKFPFCVAAGSMGARWVCCAGRMEERVGQRFRGRAVGGLVLGRCRCAWVVVERKETVGNAMVRACAPVAAAALALLLFTPPPL